jgi:diadenosine tetraphosphatase ApaH/serine/threonine PP2A family protein phosphatase
MRIFVFSDIHANINALEAVIKDAGTFDAAWCLGDLIGYGPDPNECIDLIKSLPSLTCLMGNHDAAVVGQIPLETFNNEARKSIHWMQQNITHNNIKFLRSLFETHVWENVTLAHGSPRNPVWEYILDIPIAKINFEHFTTQICMVGHTHLPIGYLQGESNKIQWKLFQDKDSIKIPGRAILNPGSVGQPRDRDARAAYAIFDTEENIWEEHRVSYNISSVQERIIKAGLPSRNAQRLSDGW